MVLCNVSHGINRNATLRTGQKEFCKQQPCRYVSIGLVWRKPSPIPFFDLSSTRPALARALRWSVHLFSRPAWILMPYCPAGRAAQSEMFIPLRLSIIVARSEQQCPFRRCVGEHARCATSPLSCRAPVRFCSTNLNSPLAQSDSRPRYRLPWVCVCRRFVWVVGSRRAEKKGICQAVGAVDMLLLLTV